ncbi:kinase-like domain-containing protein [Rhizophagus clarus]|uniref:Kinase-like domain-containing protein n=1 Tax=Rhizophagus clarus TaxID=94130 RepID=A0A8H3LKW8_9GLOM|nr:kinase-like domain-containing protein [Rhizophagus clarus]
MIDNYFALKHFFKPDDAAVKEIARELILQREVDFHNNIIRFYGITKSEPENKGYQLACAVLCLHDEEIVHQFNTNNSAEFSSSIYDSLYGELLQIIQNFDKMNTKEIGQEIIIDELIELSDKVEEEEKQKILNYLNNHKITSQEIYNRLLNDQYHSN